MLYERILDTALIYEHIIESMHDGVFTIDNSGTITTVNRSAVNILEIKKDDILNKKFSEIFFCYPQNDDFNQTILDAAYKASMSHHRLCNYYTGKTTKYLFVTTSFLKIQNGDEIRAVGINVVFSDITELQELRDAALAAKIKHLNVKA